MMMREGRALFLLLLGVMSITTAPAGTLINGGMFTVPQALGNKIIHP
jgi:hypothetical protein